MNLYDLFVKPYESYDSLQIMLEASGAIFGTLSVYFSIKKNIWVYPTGIISTLIYVYILLIRTIGDCLINVYYTIMSVYGWILWAKILKIIFMWMFPGPRKEWIYAIILFTEFGICYFIIIINLILTIIFLWKVPVSDYII
jgi:nicotinamide mononucleotide transporter